MSSFREIASRIVDEYLNDNNPDKLQASYDLQRAIERAISETVEQALKAEGERVSHLAKFYVEKNKQAITEAVEAEREACAQIARATAPAPFTPNLESLAAIAYRIAERIRARTPAKGDGK